MRKFAFTTPIVFALWLSSCVTINIYFPAAAAEEVADEIIKEIQGDKSETKDQQSGRDVWQHYNRITIFTGNLLDNLAPPVAIAGPNLSIDSSEIRQIRASMKNHYDKLKAFYDGGYVGIRSDGFIVVRNRLPLKDKSRVDKWVAAENSDRERLYRAIATANGHPEWVGDVKATFARRWVSNAHPGWWYQSADGSWREK
ncbi:MAG: YdbL family protein [Methylococcales bacterium]